LIQNIISIKTNETTGESYRTFTDLHVPFSKCKLGKNFFYPNADEVKSF